MNGLKKQLIKSFIKLTIIENKPGILKVHIAKLPELNEKYKTYDKYVLKAISLLDAVEAAKLDYAKSILVIYYYAESISAQKIYHWLQVIIDVTLTHLELIEKHGKTNMDLVAEKLEGVLKERLKQLR